MSADWLTSLKEVILTQDPNVNEVMAEVLEFTHSFLFEEGGEFVYGLTTTVDSVVFHSPFLGGDAPLDPKLNEFIAQNFATCTLEGGSLEFKHETLPSQNDGPDRISFMERFGNFIHLIATLRS